QLMESTLKNIKFSIVNTPYDWSLSYFDGRSVFENSRTGVQIGVEFKLFRFFYAGVFHRISLSLSSHNGEGIASWILIPLNEQKEILSLLKNLKNYRREKHLRDNWQKLLNAATKMED